MMIYVAMVGYMKGHQITISLYVFQSDTLVVGVYLSRVDLLGL